MCRSHRPSLSPLRALDFHHLTVLNKNGVKKMMMMMIIIIMVGMNYDVVTRIYVAWLNYQVEEGGH